MIPCLLAALIFAGSVGTPAEAVAGSATWYDAPSRTDAAAGPILRDMLGKGWRGTWVEVCHDRCVTVQLTDYCGCQRGRRLVDLDDRAFARLAPLGRGVIPVTVTRADVTPPATDTVE